MKKIGIGAFLFAVVVAVIPFVLFFSACIRIFAGLGWLSLGGRPEPEIFWGGDWLINHAFATVPFAGWAFATLILCWGVGFLVEKIKEHKRK